MVKSASGDDGDVRRRLVAAEGGAEAGEELVHAERLGDVVVGAGVEGGDLVGLGRRAPTG